MASAGPGSRRVTELPEVPTLDEGGVADYEAAAWLLLLRAPAKVPQAILDILHDAAKQALATPLFRQRLAEIPGDVASLPDLQDSVRAEISRWANTISLAGMAGSQ
jgi:tripartite-type tricarboxylate transporter receptor subunit TctC